ncbi:MAG: hypothetical protein FWF11_00655 [Coriobacteriia bacterium]|nr:hypothetical protein [Coriobacteriia bacterium]
MKMQHRQSSKQLGRRLCTWSKGLCQRDSGQMTAELVMLLPCVLLVLVIVVNVGMFFAEAARFDRIVPEVARTLVTSNEDPATAAGHALETAMGYSGGTRGSYRVRVDVGSSGELFLQKRTLHFQLEYELFAASFFARSGISAPSVLTREKSLCIFWSTGF